MPAAPIAKAHLARYIIRSSDVLAEMRVNVLEEGTENVLWYKERIMTEDEIIESVVDSATSSIRWSIHRPKRGWYLRLRSPSLPSGTFIPLIPPHRSLPPPGGMVPTNVTLEESDGTLTFAVRTVPPMPEKPSPDEVTINISVHSYPPSSPPAPPPSSSQTHFVPPPGEVKTKLCTITPQHAGIITRFVLYPSLPSPVTTSETPSPIALFSRALTYLTPTLPIRATASFTLAPSSSSGEFAVPLLTFTDRTSTFSVLTTGLLEINKGIERQMGIEPAFWIAVALSYLEYLTERDSYLAAANG